MQKRPKASAAILCAAGMLIMILDSKTALLGAAEGIELCLRTVVPSLFPFFILSILLTSILTGSRIPFAESLAQLCGIPRGGGSILLIGLLGGYPVGAQSICQAYQTKRISKQDRDRMLAFCSNAGIAFIFGMTGCLFSSRVSTWTLWLIHILSAVLVGVLLPQKSSSVISPDTSNSLSVSQALDRSIRVLTMVCGWVILFRIILCFCQRWFLWLLPSSASILLCGVLELANGCCELIGLQNEGTRFVLCSAILAFGGICVYMQTVSVTGGAGTGWYFPGKLMQCGISILLSVLLQYFLFPKAQQCPVSICMVPGLILIMASYLILGRKLKKTVAFPRGFVYNRKIKSN